MAIYNGGLNIIAPDTYSKNEINDLIADKTRSNLLRPTLKTTTQHGITCTNNGDGTFTINGTATDNAVFTLAYVGSMSGYKLTGCPTNNSGSYLAILRGSDVAWTNLIIDRGNGAEISLDTNNNPVIIAIETGLTVNNVLFKPMITNDLSATYNDFVSYDDSFIMGINSGIGLDLLWENENKNSEFAAQTITFDDYKYKLYLILTFEYAPLNERHKIFISMLKPQTSSVLVNFYMTNAHADGNNATFGVRNIAASDYGSITFENAKGSANSSLINGLCVPYQIWGIK